jgi:pimeloyl-ACP methyl ester carboxylesterase
MRLTSFRVLLVLVLCASFAAPARSEVEVRFTRMQGYAAPGTPADLNKVGILQIGDPKARNVLVLNPGTSASASYFAPLAKTIVERLPDWQVWAVERRENLLEDHSVLDQAKDGLVTGQQLFDYYLGWLTNPAIQPHLQLIGDADVAFAHEWRMRVEIEDLAVVVKEARRHNRRVVLGGHSLGGSITTAYATWDFRGKPGAKKLKGLVFIDGGSGPTPISPAQATAQLATLRTSTPWLTFGGIPSPFAGVFNATGSMASSSIPTPRRSASSSRSCPRA